jgi:hypothetical protein
MQVPDNIKVSAASFLGVATPGANLFLDNLEPVLKVALLIAQIAVAVCSALYVHSKWKKNRK